LFFQTSPLSLVGIRLVDATQSLKEAGIALESRIEFLSSTWDLTQDDAAQEQSKEPKKSPLTYFGEGR
jgi:hypothetical protein